MLGKDRPGITNRAVLVCRRMDIPPRPPHERTPWAPEQIVVAALVFAFGLLLGAGVAALLRLPS